MLIFLRKSVFRENLTLFVEDRNCWLTQLRSFSLVTLYSCPVLAFVGRLSLALLQRHPKLHLSLVRESSRPKLLSSLNKNIL